ncbi:unnamed protein product [Ectocarpus sp. CCAP 1310/34]|nr:unnamed protein product [Ectocarpus sp. CCAP 1310/34]
MPVAVATSLDDISSGKVIAPARQAPVFDGSQECYDDEAFLFCKPPSFLSNWTPCAFSVHGSRDVCGEQFMMAEKARISGDHVACAKLMATSDPREHKSFGRKVRGFDHAFWELRCEGVVFLIPEASPFDGLWGIGVGAFDRFATSPSKNPDQNLLGKRSLRRARFCVCAWSNPTRLYALSIRGSLPPRVPPSMKLRPRVLHVASAAIREAAAPPPPMGKPLLEEHAPYLVRGESLGIGVPPSLCAASVLRPGEPVRCIVYQGEHDQCALRGDHRA